MLERMAERTRRENHRLLRVLRTMKQTVVTRRVYRVSQPSVLVKGPRQVEKRVNDQRKRQGKSMDRVPGQCGNLLAVQKTGGHPSMTWSRVLNPWVK